MSKEVKWFRPPWETCLLLSCCHSTNYLPCDPIKNMEIGEILSVGSSSSAEVRESWTSQCFSKEECLAGVCGDEQQGDSRAVPNESFMVEWHESRMNLRPSSVLQQERFRPLSGTRFFKHWKIEWKQRFSRCRADDILFWILWGSDVHPL